MPGILCNEVVTSKVTSSTSTLTIGTFVWPSTAPTPGSILKTDGSGNLTFESSNVRSVVDPASSTFTVGASDDIVAVTGTLDTTITLPDPSTKTVGDMIYIVKEVDGASVITISPSGGELVSGSPTAALSAAYGSVRLYTNGTNWFALF